ncbi:MAG TPA: urea ABC transporter ATP-binding protein UrtD [Chloroflexota bacterium]|nr:urea ABC transporter ATP-binding protein UrtD [Chloroflexota bacterium]
MSGALLDVQDVEISFDGIKVLDRLSLQLQPGELRFLIGPNGAGKTTLLDVVSGKTRPHSGAVMFDGHNALRLAPNRLARLGMGRKFQTPAVFPSLTVWENLEAAGSFRDRGLDLLLPARGRIVDRLLEVLEITGLGLQAQERAGVLSHGQQQWLEIGMLLMHSPKLLLLDEPVAGLTRAERDRTSALLHAIRGSATATGCAILIVEHDMAFVRQFEATVTVLHQGRVLVEGPMATVQADERVIEVYLGRIETGGTAEAA